MAISMTQAKAAKARVTRLLSHVEGVYGIGLTWQENGDPAVLVNVDKEAVEQVKALLAAASIDVPIQIEAVGPATFEG